MKTALNRRLAAIMFTDIEGYTALMQNDEKKGLEMREQHRKVFNSITDRFGGDILQYYGDGTLSVFTSIIDAVNCGIEMQIQFQKDPSVPVRIGIHLGDIVVTEDDVIGDAVNLASRIESIAVVGSVLVSDRVQRDIRNHQDIHSQSLGFYELKNVERPVEVFAISNPGLIIPEANRVPEKSKEKKTIPTWGIVAFGLIILTGIYFAFFNKSKETIIIDENLVKSIAVMPLDDLSASKDQGHISEGISEAIISHLFKIEDIEVRSKKSSFAFREHDLTLTSYADTLNVNYVLEGSVLRDGNRIKVAVRLIEAIQERNIWSHDYMFTLSSLFEIQSEIANSVAQSLNIYLDDDERESMFDAGTKSVAAYEHLLMGSKIYHDYHNIDPKTAPLWTLTDELESALEFDSTIALAYYYLADVYNHLPGDLNSKLFSDFNPSEELKHLTADSAFSLRVENIEKAIRFENDPVIKLLYGINLKARLNDFGGVGKLVKQLPEDYRTHPLLSTEFWNDRVYPVRGPDYALYMLETDLERDPYNIQLRIKKFNILLHQQKMDEASKELQLILSINSKNPWVWEIQFLNTLFSQQGEKKIDSLLNMKTANEEIKTYQLLWKLALKNDLKPEQIEDSISPFYPSDYYYYKANIYWQRGDKEMANAVIAQSKPETWAVSFFWNTSTYFSYHIPFELDEIPELKNSIIEMGIDPGFFKPMPIFRKN